MYSDTKLNASDAERITGKPLTDTDVHNQVMADMKRVEALEVPLIHKIVENWGNPQFPLTTHIKWLKEYAHTNFVMESQGLLEDRDDWKDLADRLKGQVQRNIEDMDKLEAQNETQRQNIVLAQNIGAHLTELLHRVLMGDHAAFKEALTLLKIDQTDALSSLRKNRDEARKGMFADASPALDFLRKIIYEDEGAPKTTASVVEILLKSLNSVGGKPADASTSGPLKYYCDGCKAEVEKLKKDLQLKDIELQEARHKIKRLEESRHIPATDWKANYEAAVRELAQTREKLEKALAVNRQHVADYNVACENFRTMEQASVKWADAFNALNKEVEDLGNRLKKVFPEHVQERYTGPNQHHFDFDLVRLEKDWVYLKSLKPYNPNPSIGMLTPFMVHSGTSMWNAENRPLNEDYRDLYHKAQQEINSRGVTINKYVMESQEMVGVIAKCEATIKNLNKTHDLKDRLIADKNKVIQAMKSSTVNEGWLDPAGAKNLKDQARMWKNRYEGLEKSIIDGMGGAPTDSPVHVRLDDYKKRIDEINFLHKKMADVYGVIKSFLPSDHNYPGGRI